MAESLEREEKERLFNEHIEQLGRKKRDKFRELLDEVGASAELTASWRDIKKLLKDDPRYVKFSSSDRVSVSIPYCRKVGSQFNFLRPYPRLIPSLFYFFCMTIEVRKRVQGIH